MGKVETNNAGNNESKSLESIGIDNVYLMLHLLYLTMVSGAHLPLQLCCCSFAQSDCLRLWHIVLQSKGLVHFVGIDLGLF